MRSHAGQVPGSDGLRRPLSTLARLAAVYALLFAGRPLVVYVCYEFYVPTGTGMAWVCTCTVPGAMAAGIAPRYKTGPRLDTYRFVRTVHGMG